MKLRLAWFYPDLMSLYGDRGNITALKYRCEKRDIKLEIKKISINDKFNSDDYDLAFLGGGQDKQQLIVADDLQKNKEELFKFYDDNKTMLAICGGYQLLGEYFKTKKGQIIKGLGIFNIHTIAEEKRMIGDMMIYCDFLNKEIVGFENHSGRTYLGEKAKPLGKVLKGFGNNGKDKKEGVIDKNFIGTYLHGPLLPKNPVLTDYFIKKSLENKYKKSIKLIKINNDLEDQAREFIINNKF